MIKKYKISGFCNPRRLVILQQPLQPLQRRCRCFGFALLRVAHLQLPSRSQLCSGIHNGHTDGNGKDKNEGLHKFHGK